MIDGSTNRLIIEVKHRTREWEGSSIYQLVLLILQFVCFNVLPADGHTSVTIIIYLAMSRLAKKLYFNSVYFFVYLKITNKSL